MPAQIEALEDRTLLSAAPVADITGPTSIDEGEGLSLSASGSWDPDGHSLSFSWDINGDGVFGDFTGESLWLSESDLQMWGLNDDGTYTIGVEVSDGVDGTDTASLDVTVNNIAPTIDSVYLNGSPAWPGDTVSLSASFTDPGTSDTFSYVIDWGDGTTDTGNPGSGTIDASHIYTTPGSYTVTLTVSDDDGGEGVWTQGLTVDSIAPTISGSGTTSEGDSYSLDLTSAGPVDSWTIDWGDGTIETGVSSGWASHVYIDEGSTGSPTGDYTITATAHYQGSDYTAAPLTVTVSNIAPTIDSVYLNGSPAWPGDTVTLSASFTDPGTADTFRYIIDWGDGTTDTGTPGSGTIDASHVYTTPGSYTVTLTVSDDDTGEGTWAEGLTIDSIGPTISGSSTTSEGDSYSLDLTAAGPVDSWTINWGDGTIDTGVSSGPASHVYIDDGSTGSSTGNYTITATAQYQGSDYVADPLTVTVNNIAPVIDSAWLSGSPGYPGDTVTLSASFTDPGTADTFSYVIDWGDGTTDTGNPGSGTIDASHIYTTPGSYTVTLTISDDDGGEGVWAEGLTIDSIGPTISGSSTTSEGDSYSLDLTAAGPVDSWTINWGDGTIETGVSSGSTSHVYIDEGSTGNYTITATAHYQGSDYTAAPLTVTVQNTAPLITSPTITPLTEFASETTLTAEWSDPGTSDSVTWSVDWGNGSITSSDGPTTAGSQILATMTYAEAGTYDVTLTIIDDDGGTTVWTTIALVAAPPPPVTSMDEYTVHHLDTLEIAAPGVLANDTHPLDAPLTALLEYGPNHGTLEFHDDGSFVYTPDADYAGIDTFTYVAVGYGIASAATTVSINVSNQRPTGQSEAFLARTDTPLVITDVPLLSNDSDPDGDPLIAELVEDAVHGSVALNPDGTFTYTPAGGYSGLDSFTYRASDGAEASEAITVHLYVAEWVVIPDYSTEEAAAEQELTEATQAMDEAWSTYDTTVADLDGTATMQIAAGDAAWQAGVDVIWADHSASVAQIEQDYQAEVSAAQEEFEEATEEENRHQQYEVLHDTLLEDTLVTLEEGQEVVLIGDTEHGELVLNTDGSFTYTPDVNFVGRETFGFQVTGGEEDGPVQQVTIHVIGDAAFTVLQRTADAESYFTNSLLTGADFDAGLTVVIEELPQHGTLLLHDDNTFTYTPDVDFVGTDFFRYHLTDGVQPGESRIASIDVLSPLALNARDSDAWLNQAYETSLYEIERQLRDTFEAALSDHAAAQQQLDDQLLQDQQQAEADYDDAVAAADDAHAQGVQAADATRDTAVANAETAYADGEAAAWSTYQSARAAAEDAYDAAIAAADADVQSVIDQYPELDFDRSVIEQDPDYQAAVSAADAARDAAVNDAQAAYDSALADLNSQYDAAIATADAEYESALAMADSAYDAAVAQADATLDTAITSAHDLYTQAESTAWTSYESGVQTVQTDFDLAVSTLEAARDDAIAQAQEAFDAAEAQREAQYQSTMDAYHATWQQQHVAPRQQQYQTTIAGYRNTYDTALADAQTELDTRTAAAHAAFNNATAGLQQTRDEAIEAAQDAFEATETVESARYLMVYQESFATIPATWVNPPEPNQDPVRQAAKRYEVAMQRAKAEFLRASGQAQIDYVTAAAPHFTALNTELARANYDFGIADAAATKKLAEDSAEALRLLQNDLAKYDADYARYAEAQFVEMKKLVAGDAKVRETAIAAAVHTFDHGIAEAEATRDTALASLAVTYTKAESAAWETFETTAAQLEEQHVASVGAAHTAWTQAETAAAQVWTNASNAARSSLRTGQFASVQTFADDVSTAFITREQSVSEARNTAALSHYGNTPEYQALADAWAIHDQAATQAAVDHAAAIVTAQTAYAQAEDATAAAHDTAVFQAHSEHSQDIAAAETTRLQSVASAWRARRVSEAAAVREHTDGQIENDQSLDQAAIIAARDRAKAEADAHQTRTLAQIERQHTQERAYWDADKVRVDRQIAAEEAAAKATADATAAALKSGAAADYTKLATELAARRDQLIGEATAAEAVAGQAAILQRAQAVRLAWNGVKLLRNQAVSTFDNNIYVVDAIRSRIADLPLDAATNFFTGWADSLTGGLHGRLREAMGIDTFVDHDSGTYMAGNLLGVVHGFLLGSGAGNTAHIGWAYTSARGITAVSTTGGMIEAGTNFASGEGTVMDALDLMPAGGAVLGKLTDGLGIFRCFVGDTPVVVAVEEVAAPLTVEEPASVRFVPLATGGTCIALAVALQFHQHRRRRNRNGTSNRLVPRRRRRTPAAPREDPSCRTHTPAPGMTTSAAVRASIRERAHGRHLDELTMLPEPAPIQQTPLQLFPLRQLWNRSASAQGVTGNHSPENPSEHQPPIKQSADPPTDNWPRSLMTPISLFLLAIGSLLTWTGLGHDPISPVEPEAATAGMVRRSATAINSSPAVRPLTLPIRDVRLGQRVVGRNPLRDDVDYTTPEPDRDTWREIHLSLTKPDGRTVSIELLRPVEWLVLQVLAAQPPPARTDSATPLRPLALPLAGRTADGIHDSTDAFAVFIGRMIRLDLPEMGAAGPAVITSIRPCPPIEPDNGTGRRVVTGRFVHAPDGGLLDLLVEGESTPTGVTDNHPYWSVTRQRFVAAGQLEVGEQINTLTGPRRIHQISPRIQRETVYNLEVHSEHVYRVGSLGTLVHNVYPYSGPLERGMHLTDVVGAGGARPPRHHIFPQEFREWFSRRGVDIDRMTVPMDQGTHTAIHTMGWNDAIMVDLLEAESVTGRRLSAKEIWGAGYRQMRLFDIADLPIVSYRD